MTSDEKLDEFLKRTGIELLPFQKKLIKKIADGNKICICYPPNTGRTNAKLLMRLMDTTFAKGENND